jgi:hypothetical protein
MDPPASLMPCLPGIDEPRLPRFTRSGSVTTTSSSQVQSHGHQHRAPLRGQPSPDRHAACRPGDDAADDAHGPLLDGRLHFLAVGSLSFIGIRGMMAAILPLMHVERDAQMTFVL